MAAIDERTYWSAYPEHPKAYGEEAPAAGESRFEALLGQPFATGQDSDSFVEVEEASPFGIELGITYPDLAVDDVIDRAVAAGGAWSAASPRRRAEVCVRILDRLAEDSFTMAHAVMHTTGQAFLMAFQAGGPHALDLSLIHI